MDCSIYLICPLILTAEFSVYLTGRTDFNADCYVLLNMKIIIVNKLNDFYIDVLKAKSDNTEAQILSTVVLTNFWKKHFEEIVMSNSNFLFKAVRSDCKQFFSVLKKT
jgi:hypothetical protein